MAKMYGHKWTSSYGVADDGTWQLGLHDVPPEKIKIGLEKCRASSDEWPPTLPGFRAMCIGVALHADNAAAYRLRPKALPRPKPDAGKVASHMAAMRGSLKPKHHADQSDG